MNFKNTRYKFEYSNINSTFFGKYFNIAKSKSIKIVHCCGYDSIPSDLGCLMIQDFSIKMNNAPCDKVRLYFEETKGGFSGGTIASMLNMMEKSKIDKNMKKIIKDPYAFNILNRWKYVGDNFISQFYIKLL